MGILANELRIWNLVLYKNAELIKITSIGLFGIQSKTDDMTISCQYFDIEPIPITEEWLLKFGFEHERAGLFGNVYRIGTFSIMLDMGEYIFVSFPMLRIKHIHQLQNLYFALTGQELTQH